jgi:hypothetical protein
LEIKFSPHDLCDENHERRVEAAVQALHETADNSPPVRIRPCDLTEINEVVEIEKGLWN